MSDLGNKEVFAKNLKHYMELNNKDRNDMCRDLGFAYTTFAEWYNGKIYPKIDKIEMIANYFGIKKSDLIENKNLNLQTLVKIPVIGKIAAGHPILAQENIEGYLPIDLSIYGMTTSDELFFLRVSGQSMNLKVKNGDFALIHKQNYAEDGDIIVAIVNGNDEATLKRYKKLNDQFVLLEPMSTDLTIESITVDLKNTDFKIIGKAIGQFGKF